MKNKILICVGTSGLSAGANEVADNFQSELKKHNLFNNYEIIKTGDKGLFVDVIVEIIDSKKTTYINVKPDDVIKIIDSHIINNELYKKRLADENYTNFFKDQERIVLKNCGKIDPEQIDSYLERDGYQAIQKAFKMSRDKILEEVTDSGLKGRGGGGFLTGMKWEFGKKAESNTKYIICNADEGDPGAFMDRSVLESDPHAVLEGMIIAGYTIGANNGYIYCRAEYPLAIKRLNIAITQAKEKGFLGENILGTNFSFNLKIKAGAGAFVCGEETALIASIEGRRGHPKPRPPFPANKGLWGNPTIINNVETLANIKHIILNGAKWFASKGTKNSTGTKVFALAGKIKNTGLVEVPMGTTIKELVFGPGGGMINKRKKFKAVQLGGPSGGCLPESLIDTPIDFESINKTGAIMGSGGMIVMDESTCMVDMAKYFLKFTVAESCGKCVPCRVGLKRMLETLEAITEGKGTQEHIEFLKEMSPTIKETSLCGLGQTAPNPVLTTLKYFPEEYEEHITEKKCRAKVCESLLEFEVIPDKCTKCGLCFRACPTDALEWKKGEVAYINRDKCIKCKACFEACNFDAIK